MILLHAFAVTLTILFKITLGTVGSVLAVLVFGLVVCALISACVSNVLAD